MLTYSQVERALAPMKTEPVRDPSADRRALAIWAAWRERHGYTTVPRLLGDDVAKMQKNTRPTYSLNLAHHDTGGANLCPYEDQCSGSCVAGSGNGRYDNVIPSRQCLTRFMLAHPDTFAHLIAIELDRIAVSHQCRASIRLNAYSDIRWERIAPWVFTRHPRLSFYDYTKHPLASRPSTPDNYRLTFSVSPRTTPVQVRHQLDAGRNVAVVVDVRTGPLPRQWHGLRAIDGDVTDQRDRDPRRVAVLLRRKGTLRAGQGLTVNRIGSGVFG